jgi:Tfp pilus assembly protein PilF
MIGRYPYALAAYADLHASLGDLDQARAYLERALAHQPSPAQQALLETREGYVDVAKVLAILRKHRDGKA